MLLFNRFRLHIVDLDPSSVTTGGWLEDTSLVEKYTISEEDYAKRTGKFFSYCLESVSRKRLVCLCWCSSSDDMLLCSLYIADSFRKFKEKRVSQNPAASEVKV